MQLIRNPNFSTQFSTVSQATSAESVYTKGTATAVLVKRSFMTKMYFSLVRVARVTGPKISAATVLNRIPTLNGTRPAILLLPPVLRAAQVRHHWTFFLLSVVILGHQNRWRIVASLFSTAKCPPLVWDECSGSLYARQ